MLRSEGPPVCPDQANLLVVRDPEGKERPVRTDDDWAGRRKHILAAMQQVRGALPSDKDKVPLNVKEGDAVATPRYVRK